MNCTWYRTPDGTPFVVCGTRRRLPPCFYCKKPSERICDFDRGNGKTCDRKVCAGCSIRVGPERDLCLDHAAPMPPAEEVELVVFTGNVHKHRRDPDAFDITVLSGGIAGAPFAPSVALFRPMKAAMRQADEVDLSADAMHMDAVHRLDEEDPGWTEVRGAVKELRREAAQKRAAIWAAYRRGYLAEMLVSSGSDVPEGWASDVAEAKKRGRVERRAAWAALLRKRRVVLLCYCAVREQCHRGLLAPVLVRKGAKDGGELAVRDPNLSLFSK